MKLDLAYHRIGDTHKTHLHRCVNLPMQEAESLYSLRAPCVCKRLKSAPPGMLRNWPLSAVSHSFIELHVFMQVEGASLLQMQFKKAVEDHRGGHSVSARERRKKQHCFL